MNESIILFLIIQLLFLTILTFRNLHETGLGILCLVALIILISLLVNNKCKCCENNHIFATVDNSNVQYLIDDGICTNCNHEYIERK